MDREAVANQATQAGCPPRFAAPTLWLANFAMHDTPLQPAQLGVAGVCCIKQAHAAQLFGVEQSYGRKYTSSSPLSQNLRALIDEDTRRLAANTDPHPENAMILRPETPADALAIEQLTAAAFEQAPHSSHTEHFIVNALRRAGQLSVSLVAEEAGHIIGHMALSPVTLSDGSTGWYGLGPISVAPERHGQGIGSQLMRAALQACKDWAPTVAWCWAIQATTHASVSRRTRSCSCRAYHPSISRP